METRPAMSGMLLGHPERQRAAHGQPADEHLVGAGPHPLVGRFGVGGPLGPTGGFHVLGRAAVAGQQGKRDGVALSTQALGEFLQRARRAAETMEQRTPILPFGPGFHVQRLVPLHLHRLRYPYRPRWPIVRA